MKRDEIETKWDASSAFGRSSQDMVVSSLFMCIILGETAEKRIHLHGWTAICIRMSEFLPAAGEPEQSTGTGLDSHRSRVDSPKNIATEDALQNL